MPSIVFKTPLYHPYINFHLKDGCLNGTGEVCMKFNYLKEKEWDPFEDNMTKGCLLLF